MAEGLDPKAALILKAIKVNRVEKNVGFQKILDLGLGSDAFRARIKAGMSKPIQVKAAPAPMGTSVESKFKPAPLQAPIKGGFTVPPRPRVFKVEDIPEELRGKPGEIKRLAESAAETSVEVGEEIGRRIRGEEFKALREIKGKLTFPPDIKIPEESVPDFITKAVKSIKIKPISKQEIEDFRTRIRFGLQQQIDRARKSEERKQKVKFIANIVPLTREDILLTGIVAAGFGAIPIAARGVVRAVNTPLARDIIERGSRVVIRIFSVLKSQTPTLQEGVIKSAKLAIKAKRAIQRTVQETFEEGRKGLRQLNPNLNQEIEVVIGGKLRKNTSLAQLDAERRANDEFIRRLFKMDEKELAKLPLKIRILPVTAKDLPKQRIFTDSKERFLAAREIVEGANTSPVFPREISEKSTRIAKKVLEAINPAVPGDVALLAVARRVLMWSDASIAKKELRTDATNLTALLIQETQSQVFRIPKGRISKQVFENLVAVSDKIKPNTNLPISLLREQAAVRNVIIKKLATFDAQAIEFAADALTKPGAFGKRKGLISGSSQQRIAQLVPGVAPARVVFAGMERFKKTTNDPIEQLLLFNKMISKKGQKTEDFIKGIANDAGLVKDKTFLSVAPVHTGKTLDMRKTSIELSNEVAKRTEIPGGVAGGGYNELPKRGLFGNMGEYWRNVTIDKGRGVAEVEGSVESLKRIGALRKKQEALRVGQVVASETAKRDQVIFAAKFPEIREGSAQSALMVRALQGRASFEELARLNALGINKRKRAAIEKFVRKEYVQKVVDVNKVLTKMGRARIPFRANIGDHMMELRYLDRWYGNLGNVPQVDFDNIVFDQSSRQFRDVFFQTGGNAFRGNIEGDLFASVAAFSRLTNKIIHTNLPALDILKHGEYLESKGLMSASFLLQDMGKSILNPSESVVTAPALNKALRDKADALNTLTKMNRNFIRSVIFANPSVIMNQMFSGAFVLQNTGFLNSAKGFGDAWNRNMLMIARQKSNVIRARRSLGTEFSRGRIESAQEMSNVVLQNVDEFISSWAFLAGRRQGQTLGLKGATLDAFSDDIAAKANVLYLRSEIPAILRDRIVNLAFPIQTFSLNNYNNIFFDIPGMGAAEGTMAYAKFFGFNIGANLIQQYHGLEPGFTMSDMFPFVGRTARFGGTGGLAGDIRLGVVSEALNAFNALTNLAAEGSQVALDAHNNPGVEYYAEMEETIFDSLLRVAPLITTVPGISVWRRAIKNPEFLQDMNAENIKRVLFREPDPNQIARSVTLLGGGGKKGTVSNKLLSLQIIGGRSPIEIGDEIEVKQAEFKEQGGLLGAVERGLGL